MADSESDDAAQRSGDRLPTEPGWWCCVVEGEPQRPLVLSGRGWFAVGDDCEFGASINMRGWGNDDCEWHRVDPIPLHLQGDVNDELGAALHPWTDRPHLPLSDKAQEWAASAHQGQVDKIGEPYIRHPSRVAVNVYESTGSDEATAVAYLHDVVEDTAVTLDALRATGFPERVVAAVDAISKRKGEGFEAYYERVKANPLALVVKWHDVADNADPRRLAKVAPDTQDRLRAKYERAKAMLLDVGAEP